MTDESQYPLVTFALFAYNQERYICEAVEAALAQDYPNLEIIISDDASTDGTWVCVQQLVLGYRGSHRIVLNKELRNLGIGAHVNKVLRLAAGELVVLAAGDDRSEKNRVTVFVRAWMERGRPESFIYSNVIPIDQDSARVSWSEKVPSGPHSLKLMASGDIRMLGASSAYTRGVIDRFPEIAPAVQHEDRVLPFRAALLGGVGIYLDEHLVRYRITGGVSRDIPVGWRKYVAARSNIEARGLLDAQQRLSDAEFIRATSECIDACRRTVARHRTMISLANAHGLGLERSLVLALLRCDDPSHFIKFYLKKRLTGFLGLFEGR